MVRPLALAMLGVAFLGRAAFALDEGPEADPTRAIGRAMGQGSFPWYDAPKDAVRPVQVPVRGDWWASRTSSPTTSTTPPSIPPVGLDVGRWVSFAAFCLGLAGLVGLLAWFWRIYEPLADADPDDHRGTRGEAMGSEVLPAGLRRGFDPSDAWSEAVRRRDRGDLSGAIVCLFAHQLLTLSRLELLRLAPGRTGRQLLRSVADLEFRGLVAPTLRLFEAAYYGHREPSAEEFAAAWASAEAFQSRVASGVSP